MLDKDSLNEYCDVGLCDISTYDKESICRIIEEKIDDSKIVGVVGKLNNCCMSSYHTSFVQIVVSFLSSYLLQVK